MKAVTKDGGMIRETGRDNSSHKGDDGRAVNMGGSMTNLSPALNGATANAKPSK